MELFELLHGLEHEILSGENTRIDSLMIHSGQYSENAVFFAEKGVYFDGADFIEQAVLSGAAAVCTNRSLDVYLDNICYFKVPDIMKAQSLMAVKLYGLNEGPPSKIAVTGTNGKTSVVMIASEVFSALGAKAAYTGTLGTNIEGMSENLTDNTTFPPAVYAKIAVRAKEEEYRYLFSEVSSQGLSKGRVEGIVFDYSVFMNLTEDHLDYHNGMEDYYLAKKKLFSQTKKAVINISDSYGKRLYDELAALGAEAVSFSYKGEPADFMLSRIELKPASTCFRLSFGEGEADFCVPIIGEHNALNTAAVIIAALLEGFSSELISEAVSSLSPVRGRLELISSSNVYLDYAHTPDALLKAVSTIKSVTGRELTVVFGCGGDRDPYKREEMGKIAGRYADFAVVTNDNPRNENPNEIISQIVRGIESDNYIVIPDRKKAIKYAVGHASDSSCVLIAGKGHEEYIIIGNKKMPFSDRDCVNAALSSRDKASAEEK